MAVNRPAGPPDGRFHPGASGRDDPVVVIGAGVSGLTTAICLAEAGRQVRIWAEAPPKATVSAVAGALWGPSFREPLADTLKWTEQSLRDFRVLAEDPGSGVRLATILGVGVGTDLPAAGELPPQVRLIPDLRPCPAEELPPGWSAGSLSTMPVIDMPRYLDHLTARLTALGVAIEQRPVRSLSEVAPAASVVLNCAGLGARELAGDDTVRPVYGLHVVLTNPGIDRGFMELSTGPEWTSFVPHPDRVVCGGVHIPDRWDSTPNPDIATAIVRRCRRIEPRLNDAEIIETVTGLRPTRPVVRVESEMVGAVRCVHNYGHGGDGVSLSWGCARAAVALTSD